VKLIAIVTVKHSVTKDKDGVLTPNQAAPGEAFEIDDQAAEALIAAGSAATPEDYERASRANRSSEERIAELEAENARLRAAAGTDEDKDKGKGGKK
jgi:hypothetical protein